MFEHPSLPYSGWWRKTGRHCGGRKTLAAPLSHLLSSLLYAACQTVEHERGHVALGIFFLHLPATACTLTWDWADTWVWMGLKENDGVVFRLHFSPPFSRCVCGR